MSDLEVEWISSWDLFAALAPEWDALADTADAESIFLRHGWFRSAWQWVSKDASLAILCVRKQRRLVGILPLLDEQHRMRWIRVRRLRSFDVPDTQQFSLICAATDARDVAAAIGRQLRLTAGARDWLQLRKLYTTPANSALINELKKLRRCTWEAADTCPCVMLQDTWERYYSRRSRRLKKGNNLIANRLAKAFPSIKVTKTVLDESPAGDVALAELLALCSESWKKDMDTSLHQPGPRAWVEELRRALSGRVVLWGLRLDDELAAAELQLEQSGVVSALRADAREKYESFGTGTYLGWKLLETIMNTGKSLYNMGPGLSEYKARWAEHDVQLAVGNCYSATTRGLILWLFDRYVRPLRKNIGKIARAPTAET